MQAASPRIRKVLLVDDDAQVLELLARSLVRRKLEVVTASRADAALALAADVRVDLAIVDLCLGPDSGLDLIRELKRELPAIRIVLLSGYLSVATTVSAIRAGADSVLFKPVTAGEILANLAADAPPPEVDEVTPTLARVEWEHIARVMADCNGNVSLAARKLGVYRSTLQRRLRKPPR